MNSDLKAAAMASIVFLHGLTTVCMIPISGISPVAQYVFAVLTLASTAVSMIAIIKS